MCKTIVQRQTFRALPAALYHMLVDAHTHAAVTGKSATIQGVVGGSFSVLDHEVVGINVDLVPGVRLVQAWRHQRFPDGIFSMAAMTFTPTPDGGTALVLTHRGVPKALIPDIEAMWRVNYWSNIKTFIAQSR